MQGKEDVVFGKTGRRSQGLAYFVLGDFLPGFLSVPVHSEFSEQRMPEYKS